MIKTIVIAAAGKGERMGHLAADKPKHLVSVAGRPFLHFVIMNAIELGFKKIVVVVGYKADIMREFLAKEEGNIIVVDQNEHAGEKYGTAMVVKSVKEAVGNEPFVFQNGDSLYTHDVFASVVNDDGMNRVVGTYHPDPQHYGVIDADADGNLKQIVEKPKEPMCNMINLGIYTFQPEIFDVVDTIEKSPRGEYEIIDAINVLAAQKKVKMEKLHGNWIDLGKPEDIPKVERFLVKYKYLG